MANLNVHTVTDQDFKANVLDAKGLTVVDFWAEWCPPCKALAPTIDELATEFSGKAKIAKLDIDANPSTPAQFGIRSIPTVLVFKDGQLIEQFVGRQSKEAYADFLRQNS